MLSEAVDAARSIAGSWARSGALGALTPRLAALPLRHLSALWAQTLPVLAAGTRPNLLVDLRSLAPVLTALAGPNAAAELGEVARAITDVVRWWP